MWRRRTSFIRQLLVAFDVVTSAAAFLITVCARDWMAAASRHDGPLARALALVGGDALPAIDASDVLGLLLGLLPIWTISLVACRTGEFRIRPAALLGRHGQAVLLGLGLLVLVAFGLERELVAPSFVSMFAIVQLAMLTAGRVAVLRIAAVLRRSGRDSHRVLVVGAGARAVAFGRHIQAHAPWNTTLLGFVGVPGEVGAPEARPPLGYVGSLGAILDRVAVDEVVFAVEGRHPEILSEAIGACDERGVDVALTLPPEYPSTAKMEIANISGFDFPLLGLRRTPTGEARLAVKRALDLALGVIGLLVASPVMLATAIAIKLDSKGPVLFEQVRAGRHGRRFVMFEFRSMVVDAEWKRAELMHLNEMDGPVFKIKPTPVSPEWVASSGRPASTSFPSCSTSSRAT